jgi:hypothetical protein
MNTKTDRMKQLTAGEARLYIIAPRATSRIHNRGR